MLRGVLPVGVLPSLRSPEVVEAKSLHSFPGWKSKISKLFIKVF